MRLAALLLVGLLIGACAEDAAEIELTPLDELLWPEVSQPPACEDWRGDYKVPELQASSGLLRLTPSSVLQPIGVEEVIEVMVLRPEDATLDDSAQGSLVVADSVGVSVIEAGPVVDGIGFLRVRFEQEGVVPLRVSLSEDLRNGQIEVATYPPRLPIWELVVDEDELSEISKNPYEDLKIEGTLTLGEDVYQTKVRLHGGASRGFSKQSLRLDLQDGELETGEKKLILRAEYNDKSMLRTWLGYELFRNGTWLPTPRNQFVHLRVNGRYYGLMNRVQRMDGLLLAEWGLNPDGNLYEADPPRELAVPGGNLTPLDSEADYWQVYQWHEGIGGWADLIDFIETILILPSDVFAVLASRYVRVDDYLVYLAMMAVLQNQEHIRKNFYLYRDPAGDGRWMVLPWDLDLTLGHLWSPVNDVLDEAMTSDLDLFFGEFAPDRFGYFNQLANQMLAIPEYRYRFLELVEYISETTFTRQFVDERLGYMHCLLEPDLLADSSKWASNDEYLGRVEEIRDFVDARREFIATVLAQQGLR